MKTKIIYLPILGVLLICLWACQNDRKTDHEVKSAIIHLSDGCSIENPRIKDYKIPNPEAIADIGRYHRFHKEVTGQLEGTESSQLILGVNIAIEELYQLVCAVRQKPRNSLYIMNAIKEVEVSGTIQLEADMIFVVEHKEVSKTAVGDNIVTNVFYDFTQPCPAACPILSDVVLVQ
ncbi:MAG: hypothetical protein AAF489_05120 [Bacteroidota bacterium]